MLNTGQAGPDPPLWPVTLASPHCIPLQQSLLGRGHRLLAPRHNLPPDWKQNCFSSKNPASSACFWRFSQPNWPCKKRPAPRVLKRPGARRLPGQDRAGSEQAAVFTRSNGSPLAGPTQPFHTLQQNYQKNTCTALKIYCRIFILYFQMRG